MKANKLFIYVALSLATLSLSSCHDWLTDGTPGVSHPEDYLTSGKALVELVNATYTPNMWEYGGGAYFSEWYIGDIASASLCLFWSNRRGNGFTGSQGLLRTPDKW